MRPAILAWVSLPADAYQVHITALTSLLSVSCVWSEARPSAWWAMPRKNVTGGPQWRSGPATVPEPPPEDSAARVLPPAHEHTKPGMVSDGHRTRQNVVAVLQLRRTYVEPRIN